MDSPINRQMTEQDVKYHDASLHSALWEPLVLPTLFSFPPCRAPLASARGPPVVESPWRADTVNIPGPLPRASESESLG